MPKMLNYRRQHRADRNYRHILRGPLSLSKIRPLEPKQRQRAEAAALVAGASPAAARFLGWRATRGRG